MLFNNVILALTCHVHGGEGVVRRAGGGGVGGDGVGGGASLSFLMKTLRMLLLMLMVLSAAYIRPSMAESETNDLNTLVASTNPTKMPQKTRPVPAKLETRQYPNAAQYPMPQPSTFGGCPLCDSSVYSYCSHKLIHDSCCCDFPGSIYQKPPQCLYYECSLLYAKSCYEHSLIKNCCCNNPY